MTYSDYKTFPTLATSMKDSGGQSQRSNGHASGKTTCGPEDRPASDWRVGHHS